MELINAIGHIVLKDRHAESVLHLREVEWEKEAQLEQLADEVTEVYSKKSSKHWGTFEEDQLSYPFSQLLKQYLEDSIDFVSFSHMAVKHLKSRIDEKPLATGGYILFFYYRVNGEGFLQIVMLNDVSGTAIDVDDISVKSATHLELSKLHFGGQINLTRWNAGQDTYLSFIKGRGNDIAQYFRLFLGCTDITSSKVGTGRLIKAVRAYCADNNMTSAEKASFENKVFTYCEEQHREKKNVSLSALSAHANPEEPEKFFGFANAEPHHVDTVVIPDRNTYKRLQYISYVKGDFKIAFPNSMLRNSIHYDKAAGTLKIEQLPDALKEQLDELNGPEE